MLCVLLGRFARAPRRGVLGGRGPRIFFPGAFGWRHGVCRGRGGMRAMRSVGPGPAPSCATSEWPRADV
eukprot:3139289-Lingulodinium_polyedra.AAC.1